MHRARIVWKAWLAAALLGLCPKSLALAQRPSAEPHLVRDVLPVLKAHCVKCHGPAKSEGKLSLSTPGGLARGGEGGLPIIPGQPGDSLLWQRVVAGEMPPDHPLPAEARAVLEDWIAQGSK